jgi:hypothetical protein
VGGYQIEYHGDKSTRTAGLITAKIFINSLISTKGARFLVVDIKKLLSQHSPHKVQIYKINLSSLPQEIIDEFVTAAST